MRPYAVKNQLEVKAINTEIYNFFSKPRKQMTLEELKGVWTWLQDKYPTNN